MKLKIFILLLLTSVIAKAQTTYQLNYDNVRIGKDANSTTSFRGSLRFPYIGLGTLTDSVLVINGSDIKKVPRSQFATSQTVWGSITGTLANQTDLNNKFNNYYLSTNPSGYISGITALMVTNALGFTPYSNSNPNGYISSYTESDPIWSGVSSTYRTKTQNDELYYPLTGNPSNFLNSYTETDPLFDTKFSAKTTTNLTEGINQYYTNTRARGSISLTTTGTGAASYNSSTGVLNVPTPVTGPSPDTTVYRTVSNSFTKAQTNSQITTALTPYYLASNPNGYISSYTETDPLVPAYAKTLTAFSVIKSSTDPLYKAIGYTPSSGEITAALGYTPYNSTNPNGYTSNTGTVTNFSKTDGVGIVSIVSNPTTTPNHTIAVDTTTIRTVANSYTLSALQTKFNAYLTTSSATATYVPLTRTVSTGNGLSGGGSLSSNLTLTADTSILATKANTRNLAQLQTTFNTKQATLVSGTNIATVNGNNLLLGGNIVISGGGISGLTTNYLPKASSSTSIANSRIFDDGTNLGIGTGSPTYPLDIDGGASNGVARLTSSNAAGIRIKNTATNGKEYNFGSDLDGHYYIYNETNGKYVLDVDQNGKWFIGETGQSINIPNLTASQSIQTDASKNLVSVANTGTGSNVLATSPTLVTPTLGVATASSINKVTITAPTTSATLTLVQGSSLITSGANALTLTTTAATNATFPTGSGALGYQLTGSASLNFPSTTSNTTNSLTITVTGAAVGDVVSLGIDAATLAVTGNYSFMAYVSATNTVTVKFDNNNPVTTLDPAAATFKVKVFK